MAGLYPVSAKSPLINIALLVNDVIVADIAPAAFYDNGMPSVDIADRFFGIYFIMAVAGRVMDYEFFNRINFGRPFRIG
ncbi:MAG: hypothetical protein UT37_C0014G0011 [Parcubacteria group bacterium GW2011_GWA2_39_18]|nr:MAG: hypothetical protein UT37_C0014G0011 [Parcubacteria group bacterium GW2011_GWA2_39_18]